MICCYKNDQTEKVHFNLYIVLNIFLKDSCWMHFFVALSSVFVNGLWKLGNSRKAYHDLIYLN